MAQNNKDNRNKNSNKETKYNYLGYMFSTIQTENENDNINEQPNTEKEPAPSVLSRIQNFFTYDPIVEVGVCDSSSYADSDMGSMNIYEPIIYVGMPEEGLPEHLMVILNEKKKLNELLSKKRKIRKTTDKTDDPISEIKNLKLIIENEDKRKKLLLKNPNKQDNDVKEKKLKSQKQQAIEIIKEKLNAYEGRNKDNLAVDETYHEESIILADIIEKINLITPMNLDPEDKTNIEEQCGKEKDKEITNIEIGKCKTKSKKSKKVRNKRIILSPEEKKKKLILDLEMCEDTLEQELVVIETNIRDMEDGLYTSRVNKELESSFIIDNTLVNTVNSEAELALAVRNVPLQIIHEPKINDESHNNIENKDNSKFSDSTVIEMIKSIDNKENPSKEKSVLNSKEINENIKNDYYTKLHKMNALNDDIDDIIAQQLSLENKMKEETIVKEESKNIAGKVVISNHTLQIKQAKTNP